MTVAEIQAAIDDLQARMAKANLHFKAWDGIVEAKMTATKFKVEVYADRAIPYGVENFTDADPVEAFRKAGEFIDGFSLKPLGLAALKFWNAAVFIRRAPDRSPTVARRIMLDAAQSEFPLIRTRAITILKGIYDEPATSSADGSQTDHAARPVEPDDTGVQESPSGPHQP